MRLFCGVFPVQTWSVNMENSSCFSLNFGSQPEDVYETLDMDNLGDDSGDLEPPSDEPVSTSDDSEQL